MNQKIIIYSLIIMLAASFIYLSYTEQKQKDYNYQKNWWALYFENIKDNSLNFTIENHSDKNNFHWAIIRGENQPTKEGDMKVEKGEKKNIKLDVAEYEDKKITIRVSDGENKKNIYKDFNPVK